MEDPHDALRVAFEQHYEALLRFGVLLTGDRDAAEDLVQDAFVRLFPKLRSISHERVGAYLRSTVVNLWKNRLRRRALERRALARGPAATGDVYPSPSPRDVLWQAVTRLPRRQRACLVLRFYEDLPEATVAEILGCSLGTVKSQTSRALAHLRRVLEEVEDVG